MKVKLILTSMLFAVTHTACFFTSGGPTGYNSSPATLANYFVETHSAFAGRLDVDRIDANEARRMHQWLAGQLRDTVGWRPDDADRWERDLNPMSRTQHLMAFASTLDGLGNREQARREDGNFLAKLSYTHKQLYDLLGAWLAGQLSSKWALKCAYGNVQALEATYDMYRQSLGLEFRPARPWLTL